MGSRSVMRNTAYSFELAHSYSGEKLPIDSNGPILAHKKNCQ